MRTHVAFIREDSCIGCTKCIAVCPTDAIVGASGLAHTVITDLCIACDLCLPPCPVNCIDLVPIDRDSTDQKARALAAKSRIQARLKRLALMAEQEAAAASALRAKTTEERRAEIAQAIKRNQHDNS